MPTHQSPAQKKTVQRVMHEFKHGELKTAAGTRKVKNPKQAIAIALHEAGASKYESPKENTKNLRRTKDKERRGETGQDAAEGRGRRTTKVSSAKGGSSTKRASSAKRTSAKQTTSTTRSKPAAARSSSAKKTSTAKRAASGTKRTTGTKRTGTKRAATTKRAASTPRSPSTKRTSAAKRASSGGKQRSAANGKTRAELYKEATRRNIAGRSKMSKEQLERAVQR